MKPNNNIGTKDSCACDFCRSLCHRRPGWFLPGQAERAAALVGMSLKEFFDRHLIVDYWTSTQGLPDIFVLCPVFGDHAAGRIAGFNPLGRCAFFDSLGRCQIHPEKPEECRQAYHEGEPEPSHRAVAESWNKLEHQAQIRELLGREPEVPPPDFHDLFSMLLAFKP